MQVGSYNLELFGSERKPFGGVERGARTEAEIERIAQRIAVDLDLEVVVFEEINTRSDEWRRLKQKLAAHGYQFFEGTTSERDQFVVLAWDADEVAALEPPRQLDGVRDTFMLPGGCNEQGLRKPVAGHFRAGSFDFWIVGVHLKSRSGDPACTSKVRQEQCRDLVTAVDQLAAAGEKDVLIVGDFNELNSHESLKPLVDAGFTSQMKFLTADSAKGSYVKNSQLESSTDLIDQVWIRFDETQEVVRRSAQVMKLESREAAKRYIIEQSDHVPVWVSFRID